MTALPTAFDTTNPLMLGEELCVRSTYRTKFRRPLRTPERVVIENCTEVLILCCCASTSRLLQRRPGWRLVFWSPRRPAPVDAPEQGSQLCRNGRATLGPAVSQDGATGAGAHTKTEAVLLGTTAVIRLKSPLAHCGNSKTVCSGLPLVWVLAGDVHAKRQRIGAFGSPAPSDIHFQFRIIPRRRIPAYGHSPTRRRLTNSTSRSTPWSSHFRGETVN